MKTAKCLFVFAAAFALSLPAFGATGQEAADWITSDPTAYGVVKNDSWEMTAAGYDKQSKEVTYSSFSVREGYEWPDIKAAVDAIGSNLSSAAQNSLQALAKIALLEGKNEWTNLRISTLELSTAEAFESLDQVNIDDLANNISAKLTKSPTAGGGSRYTGYGIFNVAAAQADGKSIVSNSQDKLSLYGFPSAMADVGKIPAFGFDGGGSFLHWFFLRDLLDGVSVGAKANDDPSVRAIPEGGIQLAGFDNPGAVPHSCTPTIAEMISRSQSDPPPSPEQDPANHLVLTRYGGGSSPVIHYTQLGSLRQQPVRLVVAGYEGDTLSQETCTNRIIFASASDSDVRFSVTKDSNGDVRVSVGVYFK